MKSSTTTSEYTIEPMTAADRKVVGRLYGEAMPEAMLPRISAQFAGQWYWWIHQHPLGSVWVARDARGEVVGTIAAVLNRSALYRELTRAHRSRLITQAILRLYRPAVIEWVVKAARLSLRKPKDVFRNAPRPDAALLLIALAPSARGTGLAQELIRVLDDQFVKWNLQGPYRILTLAVNERANAFYRKLGAKFEAQVDNRGSLINEYHRLPHGTPRTG